jgi:hypothetical protein
LEDTHFAPDASITEQIAHLNFTDCDISYEASDAIIIIKISQFNSFIYVLDNSQMWPITAKHKNNSTGY